MTRIDTTVVPDKTQKSPLPTRTREREGGPLTVTPQESTVTRSSTIVTVVTDYSPRTPH